ncbi:MAG: hypothetical protein JNN15_03655 [Blastocatellia bacterium]|nr:hypothetical protein [Blastocatellia bacterium]
MKRLCNLFLIILSILIFACKKEEPRQKQETKKANVEVAQPTLKAPLISTIPSKFSKIFTGKIDTFSVRMYLIRDGKELRGTYEYVGSKPKFIGVLSSLSLNGTAANDGGFTMKETEYKANAESGVSGEFETGIFNGIFISEESGGTSRLKLEGNWSKPNTEKSTKFTLVEEFHDFGEGIKVASKDFKEENKSLKYTFDSVYPQLEGELTNSDKQFNKAMEELVNSYFEDFKKQVAEYTNDDGRQQPEDDSIATSTLDFIYEIRFANKDLISVRVDISTYIAGGAYPNGSTAVFNYNRRTGKVLKLSDLFTPGSKYLERLSEICLKLNADSGYAIFDLSPNIENYKNWTLDSQGITFSFEVAHALGDQVDAFIPYEDLKQFISTTSPVRGLITGAK